MRAQDEPGVVPFEKWHGLGNDFVIVDAAHAPQLRAHVAGICDRRRGVGADGVLFVEREPAAMRVVNADGSEPEMCGNGLRCVAAFLGNAEQRFAIETGAGALTVDVGTRGGLPWVTSSLGRGVLGAAAVGGSGDALTWQDARAGEGALVSMGNPHWVFLDPPDPEQLDVDGPRMERDARFPRRTNVEWVYPLGEGWRAEVWERGCGRTQACGTGAAACALALVHAGRAARGTWLHIALPGGALEVRVEADDTVWVAGPARRVFRGALDVETLRAAR